MRTDNLCSGFQSPSEPKDCGGDVEEIQSTATLPFDIFWAVNRGVFATRLGLRTEVIKFQYFTTEQYSTLIRQYYYIFLRRD